MGAPARSGVDGSEAAAPQRGRSLDVERTRLQSGSAGGFLDPCGNASQPHLGHSLAAEVAGRAPGGGGRGNRTPSPYARMGLVGASKTAALGHPL